MKSDQIVRAGDRHGSETVTLRKHVNEYKNMRKWMVEFPFSFFMIDVLIFIFTLLFLPSSSVSVLFHSCFSHVQVFGRTLVNKFHISYVILNGPTIFDEAK